jgi:ribosomal protein S3
MGQKINPIAFRTGTFLPWKSRWFADDIKYKEYLFEDIQIRRALME